MVRAARSLNFGRFGEGTSRRARISFDFTSFITCSVAMLALRTKLASEVEVLIFGKVTNVLEREKPVLKRLS